MNDFLKKHIQDVTKGLYCTKAEYKVLKDQVLSRLRAMNAPNICVYEASIL